MTLDEITDCMRRWNDYRTKPDALKELFMNKNYFICYYKDSYKGSAVHVYPGIDPERNIWYFVIPELYDAESYRSKLADYIQPCKLIPATINEEIPPEDALERIHAWQRLFPSWIAEQVKTEDGIYRAFYLPAGDMQPLSAKNKCYPALTARGEHPNPTGYSADLVIEEVVEKRIVYMDTVRPVPPFKPTSFYLLTLAGD